MELAVVGAGYVGLVTAACLASLGNRVACIDLNAGRIELLRQGIVPFTEPGVDQLVRSGLDSGRLTFHSDPSAARGRKLAFVSVGTLDGDGAWTPANVERAVFGLAADPEAPRWIVVRSTLLPGTASRIAADARRIDPDVRVALNPEFTREGSAVNDFLIPQRVVIGASVGSVEGQDQPTRSLVAALRKLYEPLDSPLLVTDLTSAELIKVASNVFLATKITFANELARLAVAAGAEPLAVVEGLGLDNRIGRAFLSPGPGYGGSCLPSQARALPELGRRLGVSTRIIDSVAPSNDEQTDWLLDQAEERLETGLAGARAAVLGLTFKAHTDDLRESPALRLAAALCRRGASVVAYDPIATAAGIAQLEQIEGVRVAGTASAEDACDGADVVFVATEWPEFKELDWAAIGSSMRGTVVIDARSVVDVDRAAAAGLSVAGLRASFAMTGLEPVAPHKQPAGRPALSAVPALVTPTPVRESRQLRVGPFAQVPQ